MSIFYTLAYRLGFTPWEEAATHGPATRHIDALFDREERERTPPFGRALDLGCGRGHWAITLAKRGWDVTGVDLVPQAVVDAEVSAREADVTVNFVNADITAMQSAGVTPGFRLVWDFGTVHGLTADQRAAVGREVETLTTPDATILILAWAPGHRGPLPRGMDREDMRKTFAGWQIVDEEPFDATGLPRPLRHVDPRVYRLRRS